MGLEAKEPVRKQNTYYSKEQRKKYIADWQASQLSRSEFCRQENLKLQTFCHWVKTLVPTQPTKEKLSFLPMSKVPVCAAEEIKLEIFLTHSVRCCVSGIKHSAMVSEIIRELMHGYRNSK